MAEAKAATLGPKELLDRVPQREPFRFVDEIVSVDPERIVGTYTWRPDADFYRGHFPGRPVTPGVLLVECMAQCGIVPLAIHLAHAAGEGDGVLLLFTDAEVEFSGVVLPGTTVRVESERLFYRRRKLRVRSAMRDADGALVCSGTLSGLGVPAAGAGR